jgi:hypothetical protein
MSHINECDIVIRQKNGKVRAGIPQLGLYATADEIHAAITALELKRMAFLNDLAEAGGFDDIDVRPYTSGRPQPRMAGGVGQFALKAGIVIGLIAGTAVMSTALLWPTIERIVVNAQANFERIVVNAEAKMQELTKVGGPQFWMKVERELERAAEPARDLPPEQKQKILSQIHVVVERWRPFIAELAPLFADFQRTSPNPTSQETK